MALSHAISFFVLALATYQNGALRIASSIPDGDTDADPLYGALDEFEHLQMEMQLDFDDGVEWKIPVEALARENVSRSGFEVARLWNKCNWILMMVWNGKSLS